MNVSKLDEGVRNGANELLEFFRHCMYLRDLVHRAVLSNAMLHFEYLHHLLTCYLFFQALQCILASGTQ